MGQRFVLLPVALSAATLGLAGACSKPGPTRGPAAPATSASASASAAAPAAPAATPLEQARAALDGSRYPEAEKRFTALLPKHPAAARLGLAELHLVHGRHDAAATTAREAAAKAPAGAKGAGLRTAAAVVEARALRRQGKLEDALGVLTAAEKDPKAFEAFLLHGEILLEQGKRQEAAGPLMKLVEGYNDDVINRKTPRLLAMVGRTAHLLRVPRDANDAFNEAEQAGAADVRTLLWRAELFLEKYDPGHAEEVIRDALKVAPNHPEALVWLAHVRLAQALDFDEAERLCRQALKTNPHLPAAYYVLAGIALRDMEIRKADAHADAGLKHAPRDLDLLSIKAAIRFLADDEAGFDAAKKRVLELHPTYTRMYQIVGEFAEWEHRYERIVDLMREAVRLDQNDAKAYAQLGLNLIRSGDDRTGIFRLQRAFAKDPFNVRVYNTLNLYEKIIPKGYESTEGKRFNIRYPKGDKAVLERYVPDLLDQAWKKMVRFYGFTPKTPVGIEIYATRKHFAVRTSGLPHTAIQGVCFGQTLATLSPNAERFNLGMTLWHELAHVFHIQLSKNHVPRWFTEGLAEYETLVERPEWAREQDVAFYDALRERRLPKVGLMNRAFTRAEALSDVAVAYYASSQILVMLGEEHGRGKLNRMLKLWGDGIRTPKVVSDALGKSTEAVDAQFRRFAKKELARYDGQFVPLQRQLPVELAAKRAKAAPSDPKAQARLVRSLLAAQDGKRAMKVLKLGRKISPKDPDLLWLDGRIARLRKKPAEAKAAYQAILRGGVDSFAVRVALGDLYRNEKKFAQAEAEYQAAAKLDPSQTGVYANLVMIARQRKDTAAEIAALKAMAQLSEHDGGVYRRLATLLLESGKTKDAVAVMEAGIHADVLSPRTHLLASRAYQKVGNRRKALFEAESATLCPGRPPEIAEALAHHATLLLQSGQRTKAKEAADRARKLAPKHPAVQALKI